MTISYDKNQRFTGATDDLTQSFTCGALAQILVLGIVVAGNVAREDAAPTYNSVAMTRAGTVQTATETNCEIYYLLNPAVGAAYNIVVPNSGTKTLYCQASSYRTSSTLFEATYVGATGGDDSNTNPHVHITLTEVCTIVAVMGMGSGDPPTGQTGTNLNRNDDGSYSDSNQYYLNHAVGTSFVFGWSGSWTIADDWCIAALYFKEAALTPATSTCWCYGVCYTETCDCDSTCYGEHCTCNGTCYEEGGGTCKLGDTATCGCNLTCYGDSCTCDSSCYGEGCTCNMVEYDYPAKVWFYI